MKKEHRCSENPSSVVLRALPPAPPCTQRLIRVTAPVPSPRSLVRVLAFVSLALFMPFSGVRAAASMAATQTVKSPRLGSFSLLPAARGRHDLSVSGDGTMSLPDGRTVGAAVLEVQGLPPGISRVAVDGEAWTGAWRFWVEAREEGEPARWQELSPGRLQPVAQVGPTIRLRVEASRRDRPARVTRPHLLVRWGGPENRRGEDGVVGYVAPPAPSVIPRRQWGAALPREGFDPHDPDSIVVHHAWLPDYLRYEQTGGAESVAGIQRFHQQYRGWNDVGYHYLIGSEGLVFAGRPPGVVGAHAVPNTGKIGICMIGNHDPGHDVPTDEAWEALVDLVTWLAHRHDISVAEALFGHRDFSPKSCPGELVYERFPEIRERVRGRLGSMGEDGWQ